MCDHFCMWSSNKSTHHSDVNIVTGWKSFDVFGRYEGLHFEDFIQYNLGQAANQGFEIKITLIYSIKSTHISAKFSIV